MQQTRIDINSLYSKLCQEYGHNRQNRFSDLNVIEKILPGKCLEIGKNLNRYVDKKSQQHVDFWEILTSSEDAVFLIGDGGSGKTTSLIEILKKEYENEKKTEERRCIVFLELCRIPQNSEVWYSEELRGVFIEQFLASYFSENNDRFALKDDECVRDFHNILFNKADNNNKQFTILLDGLNEVWFPDNKSRRRFYESLNNYLQNAVNVRFIITGRNDLSELIDDNIRKLQITGLDDETIKESLRATISADGLSQLDYDKIIHNYSDQKTKEYTLWECLRIPFFLIMYCAMSKKSGIVTRGDILKQFFHDKRCLIGTSKFKGEKSKAEIYEDKALEKDKDLTMDIAICILLDFIVPEIAYHMIKSGDFSISKKTMETTIESRLKYFPKNKYFYVLEKLYDYADSIKDASVIMINSNIKSNIVAHITDALGLMRKESNDVYFFTHQYFRDYFAARAVINNLILANEAGKNVDQPWNNKDFCKAASYISDFKFPGYFSILLGELLHEADNVPMYNYDLGIWEKPLMKDTDQDILSVHLDFYRNRASYIEDYLHNTALGNIFNTFKLNRKQSNYVSDLSTISFSGLDMTTIPLNGVLLSHFDKDGSTRVCADLSDSINIIASLRSGTASDDEICYAIHPEKHRILVGSETGKYLREIDYETGDEYERILFNRHGLKNVFYIKSKNGHDDEKNVAIAAIFVEQNDKPEKRTFIEKIKRIITKKQTTNRQESTNDTQDVSFHDDIGKLQRYHLKRADEWTSKLDDTTRKELSERSNADKVEYNRVQVVVYIKNRNNQYERSCEHTIGNNVLLLDTGYSDSQEALYSFIQNEDETVIYKTISYDDLINGTKEKGNKNPDIIDCSQFLVQKERNYFYAKEAKSNNNIIIGNAGQSKNGIALWDVEHNTSTTGLLPFSPEEGIRLFAVASDGKENILMYAGRTIQNCHLYEYHLPDEGFQDEWDFLGDQGGWFEIHANNEKMIVPAGIEGQFLVLNSGSLVLYSFEEGIIWKFPKPVINCNKYDNIFIIDTLDGIYMLDAATGGYSSIVSKLPFDQKNLIGSVYSETDAKMNKSVLIFDGRQIVEWYSLAEGKVKYISVLQKTEIRLDSVYGDWDKKIIYGIRNNSLFCWDAVTGNMKWKHDMHDLMEGKLIEFSINWNRTELNAIYETVKYNTYPADYLYTLTASALGRINEGTDIIPIDSDINYDKAYKHHYYRDWTVTELADGSIFNEKEDIFQFGIVDPSHYFMENTFIKNIMTNIFRRYPIKHIFANDDKSGILSFNAIIRPTEEVIGFWDRAVYTSFTYLNKIWIGLYELISGHVAEICYSTPLRGLFLANEYVILEDSDCKNLFFWNSENKKSLRNEKHYLSESGKKNNRDLCKHEIKRGILCTDPQIQSEINKPVITGRVKLFDTDSFVPLKSIPDRITGINKPAMLMVVILLMASLILTIFGLNKESKDVYVRYISDLYFKGLISAALLYLVEAIIIQKMLINYYFEKINRWACFVACLLLMIAHANIVLSDLFYFHINSFSYFFDIMVFLLIPLYVYGIIHPMFPLSKKTPDFVCILFMSIAGLGFYDVAEGSLSKTVILGYFGLIVTIYVFTGYNTDLKSNLRRLSNALAIFMLSITFGYPLFGLGNKGHLLELNEKKMRWNDLVYNIKQVYKTYNLFGRATIDISGLISKDLYQKYSLSLIIGNYGIILGIICMIPIVLIIYYLFEGAHKCTFYTDKAICMGCSALITIYMISFVISNMKLLFIAPAGSQLIVNSTPAYLSFWNALALYMAFYKAHVEIQIPKSKT